MAESVVQSTDFNPQHHQKQANQNQVNAKPGSNGGTEEQNTRYRKQHERTQSRKQVQKGENICKSYQYV